jgi:hypothetical protein
MEAVYYAARGNLRRLMRLHPQWTHQQYAQTVGMSRGWVKKWKKRLQEAEPEDEQVLHSRSRARTQPPERISQSVIDRILQMRDEPPEGLRRTPGPKALLYYLPRDEQVQGERLPRSSRTIYRILREAGRISQRQPHVQEPLERPAPMSQWQFDFKDASTVPADPFGKRQHVVEVLNVIDEGTSVLVEAQVRADFQAETTVEAVAELFERQGLPQGVRLDRDVRFVSSPSGSDFPSALVRFCECLGVGVRLCDPHHPQQNGFVERYHRTRPGKNVWPWTVLAPWARCVRSPLPLHSTTTRSVRIKGTVAATARHEWPFRPCLSCLRCPTWWTPTAGCRSGMACTWCARCAAMARCASI